MKNTEIQSRVNEALKEPVIALIENDDNAVEYIGDVKIYIAYKTPKWLSIVYTFEISSFSEMWDGCSDIGVTVNMETGKTAYIYWNSFENQNTNCITNADALALRFRRNGTRLDNTSPSANVLS